MSKRSLQLVAIISIACMIGVAFVFIFPARQIWQTRFKTVNKSSDEMDARTSVDAPIGRNQSGTSKRIAFQTPGGGTDPDDPFFIIDPAITDPNIPNGDQSFGTQNKVGVDASVMNTHSSQLDDFMVIGSANAARESYLAIIGRPKVNPQSKWRVIIDKVGMVNGQTRVLVIASAGLDVNFQGYQTMEEDGVGFVELWSLDLNGPTPILLDRTIRWFNGLQTHQESPITVCIPQFGPIGMDDPETGYMGEIGTPYP